MLSNCGAGEGSWEFFRLQGDQTSQSILRAINPECSLEGLMLKLKLQILWPPDAGSNTLATFSSWLFGKAPDARKDWGQEEKGTTEDEMVGWHHWLSVHGFEQTLGDSEGQGSWHAAVHGVAESWTRLSDWTTTKRNGFQNNYLHETKTRCYKKGKLGTKTLRNDIYDDGRNKNAM